MPLIFDDRLRKDKEARDLAKKRMEEEKMQAAKNKVTATPSINNEFIGKIIANKGPNLDNILNPIIGLGAGAGDQQIHESIASGTTHQADLKLSSFVVELEILPKPKIETYEREIQCDLMAFDPAASALQKNNVEVDRDFNESPAKKPHPGIVGGVIAPADEA